MKKLRSIVSVIIAFAVCIGISACGKQNSDVDLWENAVYQEDTELGNGEKSFSLTIEADSKSITLILHTDKETVGEALTEHKIISGEQGPYGLYVKTVNGIEADYDKTQGYWAFCQNGEGLMTGVDGQMVSDGDRYEFVYTRL